MLHCRSLVVIALAAACTLLAGCMPKMTIAQMKDKMPKRPAELDRLDPFVGKWQSEGTIKFAFLDQPLKMTGTATYNWGPDRWFVTSDEKGEMQELGPYQGHGMWNYDQKAKLYRMAFVDTMGMLGMGTGTYDEKTGTWHMTVTSDSPFGKSTMKGTLRFVNPNTQEWSMTETMGLMKVSEMHGTAHRAR